MKYLILLEGSTEKAFLEILIDEGLFSINTKDMLDLRPHQKRQIVPSLHALIRQLPPEDKVAIIKIGDKLSDRLKIPKDIQMKIHSETKYCTKPEFEILIIIAEGLYSAYQKVKSKKKAKIYAKENIILNNQRYSNTPKWIKSYFTKTNALNALKEYKRLTKHLKDEHYLLELIK